MPSIRAWRLLGLIVVASLSSAVMAQVSISGGWPAHSLTFITPSPPGGAVDHIARLTADKLAQRLGQSVVVDPRPGADGILAAEAFLGAADKDHTFIVTFGGLLISNPVTHDKLPYDAEKDFVPVSMLATDTLAICATASFKANDLSQLAALLRADANAIRWSSVPGEPRLRFLAFVKQLGDRPLYVPYKTNSQAITDMVAGRIDLVLSPLAAVLPNVHAGKLKLLAVMSAARSSIVPDVPSAIDGGFPVLAMSPFVGLFARRGADPHMLARMNQEVVSVLNDPNVRSKLIAAGLTPMAGSAQQLRATVAAKLQENRELARDVGTGWQ
jgi:tripartite-type tricarboxylate transporter receptor subunit TctC